MVENKVLPLELPLAAANLLRILPSGPNSTFHTPKDFIIIKITRILVNSTLLVSKFSILSDGL